MKITKDSEGNEETEWEGIDYFWAGLGYGIIILCLCLGIGGCLHFGTSN